MELKLRTIYPEKKASNHSALWTHQMYFYAMAWWRSSAYGTGHFNRVLYENYLKHKIDANVDGSYRF